MLEIIDFYKVLQIDPEAEAEVVQAAFRSLARKYHPDVVGGSEERMVSINHAWSVLGDPDERAQYDRGRGVARSHHCTGIKRGGADADPAAHSDALALPRRVAIPAR